MKHKVSAELLFDMKTHGAQKVVMESLISRGMFIFVSCLFLNIKAYKPQRVF